MKKFINILRIIILIACAVYLIRFFYLNQDKIEIIFSLNIKLLIIIVLFEPVFYLFQSWKFYLVIKNIKDIYIPFKSWLKLFVLSRFLNTVFSQSGNIYRSLILKKDYGISHTKYIAGHFSMIWLDLFMNFSISFVTILITKPDFALGGFEVWKLLVIFLMSIIIIPFIFNIVLNRLVFKNNFIVSIHKKFKIIVTIILNNIKRPLFLLKIFLFSVILFIRSCVVYYILFLCFDIKIGLPIIAVFYTMLKIISVFNITPGNLGIQEIVWGVLSEHMGIGMAQGILVAVFARLIGISFLFIIGSILGGFDLIRKQNKYN